MNPQERQFDQNSNYAKAMRRVEDNEKKLIETLNGEEKELFIDYANACGEVLDESIAAAFVDGFRMGANFTVDTFVNTETC